MLHSTACPAAIFNDLLSTYWASAVSAWCFVASQGDTMLPSVPIRVDVFRNFMVNATVNAAAQCGRPLPQPGKYPGLQKHSSLHFSIWRLGFSHTDWCVTGTQAVFAVRWAWKGNNWTVLFSPWLLIKVTKTGNPPMSHYSPYFLKHPHKHPKKRTAWLSKRGHKSSLIKLEGWPYCGRSGTALLRQLATHKVIVPDNKLHLVDSKMTLSEKHPHIHGQRLSASVSCLWDQTLEPPHLLDHH